MSEPSMDVDGKRKTMQCLAMRNERHFSLFMGGKVMMHVEQIAVSCDEILMENVFIFCG